MSVQVGGNIDMCWCVCVSYVPVFCGHYVT